MEELTITKIEDLLPGTNYNIIAKIVKPVAIAYKTPATEDLQASLLSPAATTTNRLTICQALIADDTA
jgi:hypothetical protein